MKKVTKDQILKEIWSSRQGAVVALMRDNGWESCPYTYDNFRQDMMRNELLVDERTIRTKWDLLISSDILKLTARNHAELQFAAFSKLMPSQARIMLRKIAESHASEVIA